MGFSKNPLLDSIVKIVFGDNSAADCPISVKFCVGWQFLQNFGNWTDAGIRQRILLFS